MNDKYFETMEKGCPECGNKFYFREKSNLVCKNWKCKNYHGRGICFQWNHEENRLMIGKIKFFEEGK